MIVIEISNKILRPALSTSKDAAIVAIKFTLPTMIVEMSALKFVPAAYDMKQIGFNSFEFKVYSQ